MTTKTIPSHFKNISRRGGNPKIRKTDEKENLNVETFFKMLKLSLDCLNIHLNVKTFVIYELASG